MRCAVLLACLLLSGCASLTRPDDITAELIARPDFKPAAQASPTWVSAALKEITRLEAELKKKK
jgi:outer membrane murein-binding lipoprotein Lpp